MAFHPSNRHLYKEFKKELNKYYNLKYLKELKWFLGICVV